MVRLEHGHWKKMGVGFLGAVLSRQDDHLQDQCSYATLPPPIPVCCYLPSSRQMNRGCPPDHSELIMMGTHCNRRTPRLLSTKTSIPTFLSREKEKIKLPMLQCKAIVLSVLRVNSDAQHVHCTTIVTQYILMIYVLKIENAESAQLSIHSIRIYYH